MKTSYTIILTIFMSFLFGCSSVSISNKASLEDNIWQLDSLKGNKVVLPAGDKITLKLTSNGNKVSGFGGCNQYFGVYKLDKDKLSIMDVGSTKMACDDMQIEIDYFNLLGNIDKYSIKNNKLYLFTEGKAVLVFQKKV